ncbi:MAG: hypothetical protein UU87_C0001G0036 [Parcubacteria group bacterium GW2011_GWA2_42_11]|nr:MAG: hypothetical protein UU87_C0001G0036 [Parcubacteria group bacterium GW2011_GWA2_42_11]
MKEKGLKILERNWKCKIGELDIVAAEAKGILGKIKTLIFVEVKSGGNARPAYAPEQHVNFAKQQKLIRLAQAYLKYKKISTEIPWRIDVVAIDINEQTNFCDIRHYENAVWG